jgi:hypothetical protein
MAILLDLNCDPAQIDPFLRAVLDKAAKDSADGFHSWAYSGLQVAFAHMVKHGSSLVSDDVALVSKILNGKG